MSPLRSAGGRRVQHSGSGRWSCANDKLSGPDAGTNSEFNATGAATEKLLWPIGGRGWRNECQIGRAFPCAAVVGRVHCCVAVFSGPAPGQSVSLAGAGSQPNTLRPPYSCERRFSSATNSGSDGPAALRSSRRPARRAGGWRRAAPRRRAWRWLTADLQHLDRLVVDLDRHGVGMPVLAAMGEREARGIGEAAGRAVHHLRHHRQRRARCGRRRRERAATRRNPAARAPPPRRARRADGGASHRSARTS